MQLREIENYLSPAGLLPEPIHTATDPHRNMRARWSDFRFGQFGHFGQFGQFGHFANCPNCLNCPKLELAGGLELENRDCTRADNDVMSAIDPDRFG